MTARFYELLGFERRFELPGYVAMLRDEAEIAVVDAGWPKERYGMDVGDGPRFELFVYVENVDVLFGALKAVGVQVIAPPHDMPWGERVAFVSDPDGNPVALANES